MQKSLFIIIFSWAVHSFAQSPFKTLQAKRTASTPKIDGILNEQIWKDAPLATEFVSFQPVPLIKEDQDHRTEVYILYDDQAIYLAARMYESKNEDISHELTNRDQIGNSDFIDILLDTYNDKINAQEFAVTAAGVQFDAKFSAQGEDENWNAVWESAVKIDGNVWTAEMKIPYSALRFANKDIQNWGINMVRSRQKFQQKLTWNPLDPKVRGFINQEGELVGIEKIKSPVRLSISPYVSSYINHYPYNTAGVKNTSNSFNGGMDVKYGINASFTLDMTLIPDFGQIQSDNQVLNLSPFEVRFNENRQFFTEGTELFNKGDLFYSRRIGSSPINGYKLNQALGTDDKIIENPSETKLVNATKISGRTAKGLGVGLFNAVTKRTLAIFEKPDGSRMTVETAPLSNYNIMVLDQNLKNNSSISIINSNVLRAGETYDANVSALVFNLNTKGNKYNLNGGLKNSRLSGGEYGKPNVGYSYEINPGKRSGNWRYNYKLAIIDDQFEPNDLGILFINNIITHNLFTEYNWFKESKWYNRLVVWMGGEYNSRYKPNTFQNYFVFTGGFARLKNLWNVDLNLEFEGKGNNFYEARTMGRTFKSPASQGFNVGVNTNQAKKISGGAFINYRHTDLFNGKNYSLFSYQNYRVNNKFRIGTEFNLNPRYNSVGYISKSSENIIFSRRDVKTVENSLTIKYTFNNVMGLNLRARHYWSKLINKEFYNLTSAGGLTENTTQTANLNQNFNAFNIDMVYLWRFAAGSELSIAWKDASYLSDRNSTDRYFRNFDRTLNSPQNNNLSVKILYYLDYLQLKRKHA